MSDMAAVIVPKSDQWNADDFIAGPKTFTIREVQIKAGEEQPVNILLDGSNKAFRPCKSMSRCLVSAWGSDAKKYVGRSLTLYRDPTVKWAGLEVGGIRISHMSDIDGPKQMMLTATRGSRKPHKVLPLTDAPQQRRDDPPAQPELTIEQVRQALTTAASYGTQVLETEWRKKTTAPYRDALRDHLDTLKQEAVEPESAEETRGSYDGA